MGNIKRKIHKPKRETKLENEYPLEVLCDDGKSVFVAWDPYTDLPVMFKYRFELIGAMMECSVWPEYEGKRVVCQPIRAAVLLQQWVDRYKTVLPEIYPQITTLMKGISQKRTA